jgi:uncharacterized membrane protein
MEFARYALESAQVLGLMILSSGLLGRNLVLKRDLTVREAKAVRLLDLYAWSGAVIVGAAHAGIAIPDLALEHSMLRYNRLEWIEAFLFFVLIVLQIHPARIFRGWNRYLVRDQIPWYTDRQHDLVVWIGRTQILLVMLLPVLPPLIFRGIGLPR